MITAVAALVLLAVGAGIGAAIVGGLAYDRGLLAGRHEVLADWFSTSPDSAARERGDALAWWHPDMTQR